MCIFIFNWGVHLARCCYHPVTMNRINRFAVADGIIPPPTTITTTKYYLAAKYFHRHCHRTHSAIAIMIHAIRVIYTQMRECDMCVVWMFYFIWFLLFDPLCVRACVRVCGHQADRWTF